MESEKKSELEGTGIVSEKLVETSTAWDGSALPAYPVGKPVVSIYKYIFPPHTITNPHFHKSHKLWSGFERHTHYRQC